MMDSTTSSTYVASSQLPPPAFSPMKVYGPNGSLATSSGTSSVTVLTGSAAAADPLDQVLPVPAAPQEGPSAGKAVGLCCSSCLTCIVNIALFVFAVMNLHGSHSDFTTGALFVGGTGISLGVTSYMLYTIKSIIPADMQDAFPWKKTAGMALISTLPLLVGGALGLTGVINNQTLGWFFFASIPFNCAVAHYTKKMQEESLRRNALAQPRATRIPSTPALPAPVVTNQNQSS